MMKLFTVTYCLLKPPCFIHVSEIVDSAIQIKEHFICKSLPFDLMGMSAILMNQYIWFCANCLLRKLIQPTIYNVINPFPWTDTISLQGKKTHFFEKGVSKYAKSGVNTTSHPQHHTFSLDEQF
jgi:ribonucleotide reductase beta subunit family protein with ferritin-like domain